MAARRASSAWDRPAAAAVDEFAGEADAKGKQGGVVAGGEFGGKGGEVDVADDGGEVEGMRVGRVEVAAAHGYGVTNLRGGEERRFGDSDKAGAIFAVEA